MKARPILFSGEMVRALLEGRKTQTRRIVKFPIRDRHIGCELAGNEIGLQEANELCPYGQPGDLLYVRETWAEVGNTDPGLIVYRANYPACVPAAYENLLPADSVPWKPSIHMPLKASRLTLRITSVRVERLQDMPWQDVEREGLGVPTDCRYAVIDQFKPLWEQINGAGAWDKNPWVWVVEFDVIKKNIQEVIAHG